MNHHGILRVWTISHFALFGLAVLPGAYADSGPRSVEIVCDVAHDCPASERQRIFDEWAQDALYEPGSTITVWRFDTVRGDHWMAATACVPQSWSIPGKRVLQAKAEFVSTARERIGAAQIRETAGPADVTCEDAAVRNSVLYLSNETGQLRPVPGGDHASPFTAVICDRSDSGLGLTCNETTVAQIYRRWAARAASNDEARFTAYLAGTSYDTTRSLFTISNDGRSPGERLARLLAAEKGLSGSLPQAMGGSAIAEAINVAVTDLRDQSSSSELIILSDLRQFTRGRWNFEVAVPKPEDFERELKRADLMSDLRGVSVFACGLHNQSAPKAPAFDPRLASQLREAWEYALQRMGAAQVRLTSRCDTGALPSAESVSGGSDNGR